MLPNNIHKAIADIGKTYKANKIVLFGSRARDDERERSDIDIAVYGLPMENQSAFLSAIDNVNTLLEFDVIFISENTSPLLLENIRKDGIPIMDKFKGKYENLINAVARLEESISDYEKSNMDSVRDGVIKRFEFCTELSWKTLREYLIDQGYTEINSPRSVMKAAFADKIIDDEIMWIDIINARNLTAHIYDEKTAQTIYANISTSYIKLFHKLIQSLK